jgi:hypothetical protein
MRDARHDPHARLAATLTQLCQREGLDPHKTAAVLRIALNWTPGLPRNPTPLLRRHACAAQLSSHSARSLLRPMRVPRSLNWQRVVGLFHPAQRLN